MILPVFFEFKNLVVSNFESYNVIFKGIFSGGVGQNIQNFIYATVNSVVDIFNTNVGLAIYGVFVVFVVLPFCINVGKYALQESLYAYMTSNSKIGFFSVYVRSLKKSLLFAIGKTIYNVFFLAVSFLAVFGLAYIKDKFFVNYLLCLTEFVVLVILFTINQITVLGWAPSLVVFDCNIFKAYCKGIKAVKRHLGKTLVSTALRFAIFWAFVIVFGFYTLAIIVPAMAICMAFYGMVVFYTSQGMRYYVSATQIMTPKKLEEVDDINKTASIL